MGMAESDLGGLPIMFEKMDPKGISDLQRSLQHGIQGLVTCAAQDTET